MERVGGKEKSRFCFPTRAVAFLRYWNLGLASMDRNSDLGIDWVLCWRRPNQSHLVFLKAQSLSML